MSKWRILVIAAGLPTLAAAWAFAGPSWLGAPLVSVTTAGVSMEPQFHTGDLALVRAASNYRVGEIVAYRSPLLDTVVLHRIVARDGDGYVFKGDNNGFRDPERLVESQLIGKLWLHIPGLGGWLSRFGTAETLGFLGGLAALLLAGGTGTAKRRRRGQRSTQPTFRQPRRAPGRAPETAPTLSAAVLLGALAVGVLAFSRPASVPQATEAAYTQSGTFSYSAAARPGAAYPRGRATTGQAVFVRLADRVDTRFDYRFSGEAPSGLAGTASLAVVLDDGYGWTRTLPLQPRRSFAGDHVSVDGTLRLARIRALLRSVAASSGQQTGSYTLTLTPHVRIRGALTGEKLRAVFVPRLSFTLDELRLRPLLPQARSDGKTASTATEPSPLAPSETGSVRGTKLQPAIVSVFKLHTTVAATRRATVLTAGVAALGLILTALLLLLGRRNADEPTRIEARHGSLLVPVGHVTGRPHGEIVEVTSIETLVRIAERYDRMILHEHNDLGHSYRVADDGAVYIYLVRSPVVAEPRPPRSVTASETRERSPSPAPDSADSGYERLSKLLAGVEAARGSTGRQTEA
jgi:signal peptidase I